MFVSRKTSALIEFIPCERTARIEVIHPFKELLDFLPSLIALCENLQPLAEHGIQSGPAVPGLLPGRFYEVLISR